MSAAKIRVIHFIDTLSAGGAERQLVYLLENLDRDRFECHVLTTYDTFRHYEATIKQLCIPLYNLHHGELTLTNRGKAISRYVRLMWMLRPHIVHGWLHYPNLIARIARPSCPPHRLITAIRSNYNHSQRRTEGLTSWLSDFRIVNKHIEDDEYKIKPIPIAISNGIPLAKFAHQTQLSTRTETTFNILIPARIEPRKGHLVFLEGLYKAKLKPSPQVTLIGEVTDTNTQLEINASISKFNLHTVIRQLPTTDNIAPHYHNTDITVLPSITESFPNVILESFAAAKPIMISTAANNTNIVEPSINGWVFPTGDSDTLAYYLNIAANTTSNERKLMGERGRVIAEQYTIEKMVKRYSQLYEQALSDS